MLLKKGADYNATNKHDANPAVWAEQYGYTAIQALVRKAQAAGDQPEEDPLPPGVTEDLLEDLFLNKSQVMSFWEAFNVFDADNSGSIDTDEFGKTLRGIGYHPSEAEIADCIDEADADGSGALDFLEFIEIMARRIITDEEDEKGYDYGLVVSGGGIDPQDWKQGQHAPSFATANNPISLIHHPPPQ